MSQTLVKICGIQSLEDLQMAAEAGADMLGVIFAPSKRQVDLDTAKAMGTWLRAFRTREQVNVASAPDNEPCQSTNTGWFQDQARQLVVRSKPLLVGVFRNQPLDYIVTVAQQVPLDLVQLHGTEDLRYAQDIPLPVIKAFHVDDTFSDLETLGTPGFHHYILLDAKVAGTSAQGGHGQAFDWKLTAPIKALGHPFILAGGLRPENVRAAVTQVQPWMVDVSSGVETEGRKDRLKIQRFIKEATQREP
ncbi:anthranilate synthase / indole-3-glycerol phosphate synthase [Dispira parvispora]|uniref:N-(5'-phosphoribosyl)anthranilate isomerase n=1 Tax=Dispira parvispora TaxID=1520584 RepID=A0A9W8B1W6_9FUNG|nr:anthranilate synthase / indole-3-glycerol phosphate synthase [Dispira parvispora]